MAATRIADYYASRVVRVAAAALCLSGLALYAFTFAPWFKHQDYGTPRERFLEDSEGLYLRVSGWEIGSVWPLVAAAAVVYALTLVAYDSGVWLPEMILVCPLAGIVGYLVRHWLVAFVPVPLVIVYIQLADVKGLGVFALLYLALLATGAVIAGVAARAIQRRLADTAPALS
jgi:hypothetical protein